MYIYIYIYMYIYVCVFIYIYICMYIYVNIYIYILGHTPRFFLHEKKNENRCQAQAHFFHVKASRVASSRKVPVFRGRLGNQQGKNWCFQK